MPIANVVNMASHLQNASRARLGMTSVPFLKYNVRAALALHRAGYIAFLTRGGVQPPDPATISTFEPELMTFGNISKQRLWIGLKYHENEPVMRTITPISKPSRAVTANLPALEKLVRGFDASYQKGLSIGESIIVNTDRGTLEIREAVARKVGGMLLCRVGP
ncbi:ribosomal protein S8 [Xylaria intraflava]|nr:ribosomal protein S8 [Xylaria intraflava]